MERLWKKESDAVDALYVDLFGDKISTGTKFSKKKNYKTLTIITSFKKKSNTISTKIKFSKKRSNKISTKTKFLKKKSNKISSKLQNERQHTD